MRAPPFPPLPTGCHPLRAVPSPGGRNPRVHDSPSGRVPAQARRRSSRAACSSTGTGLPAASSTTAGTTASSASSRRPSSRSAVGAPAWRARSKIAAPGLRPRSQARGVGHGGRVERRDLREHRRVGLGVREVVGAAEDVADPVVERGAGHAERPAGERGPVQQPLAIHRLQALAQRPRSRLGEQRGDRRRARRPQRVDAVGERVHGARRGDRARQVAAQVEVVDHVAGAAPPRRGRCACGRRR